MSLNAARIAVFSLTFISYAFYHASRKNLSGVKASMMKEWLSNETHEPFFNDDVHASTFLGLLDALFMIWYAFSLVFWGWLGDRWNPLNVVVIGMIGSGVSLFMFGAIPYYTHFYSILYYVLFYSAFGIMQAAGWPNEVTIMANWYTKANRGFIMGLWAACQPVGNIFGAVIVALVQPLGFELTFLVNAVLIMAVGLVMWSVISPRPQRSLLDESNSSQNIITEESTVTENEEEDNHQPISMLRALTLPNVLPYCLCNACLKFVNYAFFFWLPFYLQTSFGWDESTANQLSTWYDLGGIVGSVVGGMISDRLGHRSPVITAMLFCSLGLLFGYSDAGPNQLVNIIIMSLLGFTISGPYNLIVGTISVDLGSQPALSGNPKAMSTVTGLVDASGSAGSAIGQIFIPVVQNALGWVFVFYLFIVMNALATLCLLRRCILDVKDLLRHRGILHQPSAESEPLLHQD